MSDDEPQPTQTRLRRSFVERIRKVLAHDLRTPLGTISNYATILECHSAPLPEDVRTFATRIRSNAVRTANMLESVTDAIALSQAPAQLVEIDPAEILRGRISRIEPPNGFRGARLSPATIRFDPDLLAFAWRAFLTVNAEAHPGTTLDVDIEIDSGPESNAIDLWVGSKPELGGSGLDAARFAPQVAPNSCYMLALAAELFELRGGGLSLWGSPGRAACMRTRLPHVA
jgi:K+-sensing histidine kinase KdpD